MQVRPIMGAKYHTIHHITYRHNYGHYFTFMDRLFGSHLAPEDFDEDKERRDLAKAERTAAAGAVAKKAS